MPKSLFRNKAPVPYVSGISRNYSSPISMQNPLESYLYTYQRSGTVYGVVSLLAENTASQEWRLYRKTQDSRIRYSTGDTGSDPRTEVVQHQALNVLSNPNPFMSRMFLFELSQIYMELTGESWWLVDYGNLTFPQGIWPVRPDKMIPVTSATDYLAGYIYLAPDGDQIPFKLNEIVINKYPNPVDPYRGQGAIQSVMPQIESSRYAAEYDRNFFYNSASPGGIIQVPVELTDEEFDQLTNRWRESHKGVSRAHRVAVLDSGMTWTESHTNQKDMDFVNLTNVNRDMIREATRTHKVMVGQSEDVNRANAQTGEEVFASWQIEPRLKRWREVLNGQFLPLFGSTGQGVEFDYIPPNPNNREQDNDEMSSKAAAVLTLVQAGADFDSAVNFAGAQDVKEAAVKPVPRPLAPPPSPTGDLNEQQ